MRIWVLLLWCIWLALVNLIIIILIEWVWCTKAVEAVTLGHLGSCLDKGVVIVSILIRDHILILIRVLLCWCIWLALVNLIIIILIEWVWCTKAVKAITLLHLGSCLNKGV